MLERDALRAALERAPLSLFAANVSHIALYKWRDSLLSPKAARERAGRYHIAGGSPALYFADNPVTALYEVGRMFRAQYAVAAPPGILLSVRLELASGVLDLRKRAVQALLGTSRQELTGQWLTEDLAPTQLLGETAYELGNIVAVHAPSAADPSGLSETVVIFKDRLPVVGGTIEIHDPEDWLHAMSGRAARAVSKNRR